VPVPPPRPGGHKDHVGPVERLDQLSVSSSAAWRPTFGVGARAKPLGQLAADLDLVRGAVQLQRLQIRVGDDELDPVEPRLDHAIDGIASATAHTHDLDTGARAPFFVEFSAAARRDQPSGPPSEKLLEQRAQPAGHASESPGPHRPSHLTDVIPVRVHHEPTAVAKAGLLT